MKKEPFDSIESCIRDHFGSDVTITGKSYVGGGDINDACMFSLSNGERIFMKSNALGKSDFFRAEEEGLLAIAQTGEIRIPAVIGRGIDTEKNLSFLMLEYVDGRRQSHSFWEDFGHALAKMHLADTTPFVKGFGFPNDNYIGATKQINMPKDTWLEFFIQCRLLPQFAMADAYFDNRTRKQIEELLDRLPDYLSEPAKPSLLHGDLWSGNYIVGNDQNAWLIDPAAYVGHFEADLAMTELFGGFPNRFYAAYSEINPIDTEYRNRKPLYNLYHLLNHLNLFGPAYYSGVMDIVQRFC